MPNQQTATTQEAEKKRMLQLSTPEKFPVIRNLPLIQAGIYVTRHVDLQLSQEQAENMRRLFDWLNEGNARLKNGRHIDSVSDCVRWLLERIE